MGSKLIGVHRGLQFSVVGHTYTLLDRAAVTKDDELLAVPDSQAYFIINAFLRQDQTDGLWRSRMREVWELLGLGMPVFFSHISDSDISHSIERYMSDALLMNRLVLLEERITGPDKSGESGKGGGAAAQQNQNRNQDDAGRKKSPSGDSGLGPKKAPKTFVAIVLRDETGKPVSGEKYRVTAPDGSVHEGVLDEQGGAYIDQLDPGNCQVQFPDIDAREWRVA